MTPEYGVCPACRRGRALCKDRTLGAHQRLHPAGYSLGRCSGSWEPALAILPGKPANRLDIFLEPGAAMPDIEPTRPQPEPTLSGPEGQLDAASRVAAQFVETLVPAIAQALQAMLPVLAKMGETLEKISKDTEIIGQHLATANRRDRTR